MARNISISRGRIDIKTLLNLPLHSLLNIVENPDIARGLATPSRLSRKRRRTKVSPDTSGSSGRNAGKLIPKCSIRYFVYSSYPPRSHPVDSSASIRVYIEKDLELGGFLARRRNFAYRSSDYLHHLLRLPISIYFHTRRYQSDHATQPSPATI